MGGSADSDLGAYMGGTTFEKFGVTSTSTQDKLRHVALDTVAAVVAGNGSREHSVAPDVPVYTVAEVKENKAPTPTGTLEHGFVFVLLSDTQANGRYEALVYMSKPETFRLKTGKQVANTLFSYSEEMGVSA